MSNVPFGFGPPEPGEDDDSSGPDPAANPFGALFGAGLGGAPGQPVDLGAAFQQLGQLLSSSTGPVNWKAATDTARQLVDAAGDGAPSVGDRALVDDALRLAELWLNDVTELPPAVSTTEAWSRGQWVSATLPQWKDLVEPLAERMAEESARAIPEEMRAVAGPMLSMVQQMSGAMFGMQVGQGLGALAGEVVGSTDVGIPLAPAGTAVLLPVNLAAFGEGLGVPDDQVRLYLALREVAHVRLFHHAPWLRSRITSAVSDYARGISIDLSGLEGALGGVDPTNPEALNELMTSGMFEPATTPEQQATLARLETLLALVEGWVDVVVDAAASPRLPAAGALRESVRRRRATGGPAEATFANLVGLELRPRRSRDAAALWLELGAVHGTATRDAVWNHPDLLPTADDLDDPTAFFERAAGETKPLDVSVFDDLPPSTDTGE
jgi:putative hydrolase